MRAIMTAMSLATTLLATPFAATANDPDVTDPVVVVSPQEQARKLALSRKFIALMQTDQMTDMMVQMSVELAPDDPSMDAEERALTQEMMAEMMESMVPRLFDAMAPIYADIFTLEELEGLVDFYQSDIGQSMIRKSYESTPRIMAVVGDMMPSLMADMADSMCERMECTADQLREVKAAMAEAGY